MRMYFEGESKALLFVFTSKTPLVLQANSYGRLNLVKPEIIWDKRMSQYDTTLKYQHSITSFDNSILTKVKSNTR